MKRTILLLTVMALSWYGYGQNTTISGTIKGADGEGLIGATVLLKGTNIGTRTDTNGDFSLTGDRPLPWTLVLSYIGYKSQEVSVSSASSSLNITMEVEAVLSDEVIISASRRPEKVQDAPASVEVINASKLAVSPQIDPTRNLMNVPGVQVNQQSAGRINIEMRASSALFSTTVFPIMDYRSLVGPGIGTFESDDAGLSTIDLQRIEVVKGPGSALYGPGVVSGVVHFITKNPIDFPGTTIELIGGELNTIGGAIRHAGRSANKKFGYKINAHYKRGDEFTLDINDPDDAAQIAKFQTTVSQPQITNGVVDVTKPLETLLTLEDLDEDGDGNPMINDWYNTSINATLEFRPQDDLSVFVSGGYNNAQAIFYNSQGEGFASSKEFWTQARMQKGGLFAQFFFVDNDGGSKENPTFLYQTGLRTPVARKQIEGQLQYNFDLPNFLNANITAGADYRLATNDTENLVYGRNEDDDDYQIAGVYAQGKFILSPQFDVVLAGRYDVFNFLDEASFSPRVALVYKPNPRHTFRATYNQAAIPPSGLNVNIDFPVASPVPGLFDLWLTGQKEAHTYTNPVIDLTVPGLPDLPFGTPGFPLALAYGAVAEPVIAGVADALGANPGLAPLVPSIVAFLSDPANFPAGTSGAFAGYNIFDGQPLTELDPTQSARLSRVTAWELGYKGLIADKLSLSVDIYNQGFTGFTRFTALAPTYAYVGLENLSDDLGAAVTAGVTPFLTDLLINAGQDPAVAAATAGVIAGQIGGGFAAGGDGFEAAVAPLASIFGTVESDLIPQGDGITHVTAGYRTFDDAKRDWWGADIGLNYFATDALSFFANYSWISQNEWIPGEDNDDGLLFPAYQNSAKNKYRIGANLTPEKGVTASASFQHDDEFFANFGQFAGIAEARNLVDASLGYNFGNGLLISASAINLFNNEYRPYPNFPKIGRRALVTLRYTFGDK